MPSDVSDLRWLSARELADLIERRTVSPTEVTTAFLDAIRELNGEYNAYVDVLEEDALADARARERALTAGGALGPLHGVPVAIKDYEAKTGVRNTCGVAALREHVADSTAPCVERLERAGAIVLGTTNTPELGHKATTDNLLFGPTSTPFRRGMNSGGSSGGSASAVAAGLAPIAQGGDGGGSVRIPASMCGVVGMKPSWGRIPIHARPNGFVAPPRASVGPFARTVADAALMLNVMSGPSSSDLECLPRLADVDPDARASRHLRIGYSSDLDGFPVSADVRQIVEKALAAVTGPDVVIEPTSLGFRHSPDEMLEVILRDIAVSKAAEVESLGIAGFDIMADPDQLPDRLLDLIEAGRRVSALDFVRGGKIRTDVFDAVERALADFDVLVTPTLAVAGVPNGTDGQTIGPATVNGVPVDPTVGWCLTFPFNFTGHPAISVPAGLTPEGLPVGLQIVGPRWRDDIVLAVSAVFEQRNPWLSTYAIVRDGQLSPRS